MRSPSAAAASLLLAGSLLLSGCSLLSGGDDEKRAEAPAAADASPEPLASTAWQSADAADVEQGGSLRLAASTLPTNFNPLHADAANSDAAEILAPTAGGAIRITADGGWEVDPDYARSVEVVEQDPLTIEVRLNRDAVWGGGTSITAKDMVAFWKAQNGSDDDFEVISTTGYDQIDEVTPGRSRFSYTVTFDEPTADWPLYVYPKLPANVSSSPKLFNSAFRDRAISSNGPYVVTSIDTDKGVIVQEPNPRWWGERPKLDQITWNVADPELQAEAFATDGLDAVDLQASTYDVVDGVGTVQRAPGVEWSQLTLNGGRGPLQDVDVRRAVAHAIDRDPIAATAAEAVGGEPMTVGSLLLVPGQRGYRDSSASIAYDPAESARLLKKAGYTQGADGLLEKDGDPLQLTMPVPEGTPTNNARATAIVKDLRAVGIDVALRSVPADSFFDQVVIPLNFDLVTFVRRASPFPLTAAEPFYFPLDSPQNYTGIGSDRFGLGFSTVIGTLNDTVRTKRIAKLDEWLFDEVPVVPLAVTPVVVAVRDGVVNYGASQFEQVDWTTVGFRSAEKQTDGD